MPGEETNGAAEGADDSIRGSLAAALAEHEGREAATANGAGGEGAGANGAESAAETVASEGDGEEAGQTRSGPKRGADGKFVKGEGDAGAEGAEAGAKAGQAAEGEVKPDGEPEQKPTVELPSSFSPKDRADFAKLPAEGQRILKDMIARQDKDYSKKTAAAADLKREYEPVDQIFAPHREIMRQKGLTPGNLIQAWANVEQELASGDINRQLNIVSGLIQNYRIDRAAVAKALGLAAPAGGQQDGEQGAEGERADLHPAVAAAIQAAIGPISQKLEASERAARENAQRARQTQLEAKEAEINEFKSAQDDKGSLIHPHWDELEDEIHRLALTYVARNQPPPPLQQLYENAEWANPSTREKLLTARQQAAEQERKDQERAKAARATRAGSSVTGAPGPGQSAQRPVDRSLKEELQAAFDESEAA